MAKLTVINAYAGEPNRGLVPLADLDARLQAMLATGDDGAIHALDFILEQAVCRRASDVHIEPWDDCICVRFRIDGMLHEAARLPRDAHGKIVGRVKVVARMVTYQKDIPQDGRIDPEMTPCGKAMRVSTLPTVDGEKVVIRVLDSDPALFALNALGFRSDMALALRDLIARPQGTLLLTGPASSGKTTTIYAMLREIMGMRAHSAHVVTIEDPVEYRLGHVAQAQVNPHMGFTFDTALRAVLRQDPEVIMLGEIRDSETARAAIQAGLTGHLVISTIHSGTAAGVFTRLLDMGIEPYLVASSVTGVIAQRLVRRICPECRAPYKPDAALCARYGLADMEYMRGAGCDACLGIGYIGRAAIGELLMVDDVMGEHVLARSRTHVLHEQAVQKGMVPLADDAASRVREGLTTIDEIHRVLPASDDKKTTGVQLPL
jgi:type II secretory ATPase GspE/PulE/Tfp pilus assembly ATPase PilB-like protein